MSQQEIGRMVDTFKSEPEILAGMPDMSDVSGVVSFGQSKGFAITESDVNDYVSGVGANGELSDAQLGAVAGGKHKPAEPQPVYIAKGVGQGFVGTFTSTGGTIPASAV
jgi:hypothetical protein